MSLLTLILPEPESVAIASKEHSTQFWHVWALVAAILRRY